MVSRAARIQREYRRYRAILTRWGWLIALCGVIAAASAYVVSERQAPLYRTTTLLVVHPPASNGGDAYTNLLASEELVQFYLTLIKTPPVLQLAARQVGGISADELAAEVRLSNPGLSTPIIQVEVDDRYPLRAARLADAIATAFARSLRQSTGNSATTGTISVFAPAVPPTTPYAPQPRRTAAVAGLAGLVLAVGLVLLLQFLDDRIRTAADVEEVMGLVVIGTLGSHRAQPVQLAARNNWLLAKSFQTLRTNLGFASLDRPLSTIVVTSAVSGEGKTTVAINLAMSLAAAGKRVLLIDADLRHPAVHKYLDLLNRSGLTLHLLAEEQGRIETPPYVPLPAIPNLSVLTAGPSPADPTEMLGSARMRCFVQSMLPTERHPGQVDVVVLDTPPVASFADAAMLAAFASGTLLVVDASQSRQGQAARALEALRRVDARIVGVVLNRTKEKGARDDHYAYDLVDADERQPNVPPDETLAVR